VASPDTVFHRILPSRSAATAKTVLGDYAGVVLVDGYAAYQTATKSGADGPVPATLALCWAHVRRKFFEAKQFAPTCEQVLELIGQLYAVEADLPECTPSPKRSARPCSRSDGRCASSTPRRFQNPAAVTLPESQD
jgi:transposase